MLCFRKFLVPKKFMDKKGGVSLFSGESFCLRVPKKFVGEPFSVTDSGYQKILCLRGSHTIFCRIFFVSQNQRTSQGNPSVLCVRKILVAKKFMDKKGGVSIFSVDIFLSHSAEKSRRFPL